MATRLALSARAAAVHLFNIGATAEQVAAIFANLPQPTPGYFDLEAVHDAGNELIAEQGEC